METFLKTIPSTQGSLELAYPSSYKEKLVRRRLRQLAHQGKKRHRTRLLLWCLTMVPQMPLMLTPLPNITVYYTGYRIYSHYKALQGSKSLEKGFAALDSQQLRALRDDLLRYQAQHDVDFPAESWPAKLIKKEKRYLDIFERFKILQKQRKLQQQLEQQMSPEEAKTAAATTTAKKLEELEAGGPQVGLAILLSPSQILEDATRPAERKVTPIGDEAAVTVAKAFHAPQLLEYVARGRKRVTGSMFPTHVMNWTHD